MYKQASRVGGNVFRSAALRSSSGTARGVATSAVPLKILRSAQRPTAAAPIVAETLDRTKRDAYLTWQRQLMPKLAELDHEGLRYSLFEAEKRLPLLPDQEFLDAWLEATKPVLRHVGVATWELAESLGARPDQEFMRLLGLATADVQKRRPETVPAMFSLFEVMQRWGGTRETMGPFLKEWETAALAAMRERKSQHLYSGVGTVFHNIGYMPSRDFVHEWITNARLELPEIIQRSKHARAVWKIMNCAALMPTDEKALVLPLLEQWAQEKPRFDGLSEKGLLVTLYNLGDSGFEPHAHWVEEVSAELLRRLPKFCERHATYLSALSSLVTPERDKAAMCALARAWAAATIGQVLKWPARALVESFAVLMRLQMGPTVIGVHWFRTWLLAARRASGRHVQLGNYGARDLLLECRAAANDIVAPLSWKLGEVNAAKAARMLRQLEDFAALDLTEDWIIRMWLHEAMKVDTYQCHHVQRAARRLRNVGAEWAVQEWENHNSQR